MGTKRVGLARLEALMKAFTSYPTLTGSNAYRAAGRGLCTFDQQPIVLPTGSLSGALGGADAVGQTSNWNPGTDTGVNIHQYSSGMRLYVQNIGQQTVKVPAIATNGMNYSYDAANNEGIQWVARNEAEKGVLNGDYFKVGTSPAFFVRARFTLADVSDTDDCCVGFRKVEAFTAAVDDYNDGAWINVEGGAGGKIKRETILANAATVVDGVTGESDWADAESHELKVVVDKDGAPTYFLDGEEFTTKHSSSFTFAADALVTPFMYHIHDAASTMGIVYEELEWGLV